VGDAYHGRGGAIEPPAELVQAIEEPDQPEACLTSGPLGAAAEWDSLTGAARQRDSECRPLIEILAGIDGPAMSLNDRPRDR